MYRLTGNPDAVWCISTETLVSRGTWLWAIYEQFLAGGGDPEPKDGVKSLAQLRDGLMAAATAARWEHETGGIELGGVRVGTALDDQNRLSGVLAAIALGGLERVDFKAQNGWVELTAPELQAIAQAISAHVQACFSAERAHHEAIAQLATLAEVVAYDVEQGWP